MLIKKNKYFYKLTLYPRNQKPFVFLVRKEINIEVSISRKQDFFDVSYRSLVPPPMSCDEYKVTLRNINENTAVIIYRMFQASINTTIIGARPQVNLEVKNRSEKIMLYNVLIESEFPGFAASYNISRSITFIGKFAEYTYA